MPFPYQRILCPIDFDDNSLAALDTAADLARRADGTVYVFHVVPMIVQPTAMPVYVDIYKSQEEVAWGRLKEIARSHLAGTLGAAILSRLYELKWATRSPGNRIVDFTRNGEKQFVALFGVGEQ